jgi:hypothetical protein
LSAGISAGVAKGVPRTGRRESTLRTVAGTVGDVRLAALAARPVLGVAEGVMGEVTFLTRFAEDVHAPRRILSRGTCSVVRVRPPAGAGTRSHPLT